MANKLQSLEHIDGQLVKYSTITSQYPELFIQRKRNSGELIITTDVDSKYGMHHIYVGGEHIASGYGFANTKLRNDLTYVQETYTSVFNFFNSAYTYQLHSYTGTTTYITKVTDSIRKNIEENSYKLISVDKSKNKIPVNGVEYYLSAHQGTLALSTDAAKFKAKNGTYIFLSTNEISNVTPLKTNSDSAFNQFNNPDGKYINSYTDKTSYNSVMYAKYGTGNNDYNNNIYVFLCKFEFDINTNMNLSNIHFSTNNTLLSSYYPIYCKSNYTTYYNNLNLAYEYWTQDNFHNLCYNQLTDNRFNRNDSSSKTIYFPIIFYKDNKQYNNDYSSDIIITVTITDNNVEEETHKIYFTLVEPISYVFKKNCYVVNTDISYNTSIIQDFTKSNYNHLTFTNTEVFNEDNDVLSYTMLYIPDSLLQSYQPLFYISNDLDNQENNEGGMISYVLLTGQQNILNTTAYTSYISNRDILQQKLRYDIKFVAK